MLVDVLESEFAHTHLRIKSLVAAKDGTDEPIVVKNVITVRHLNAPNLLLQQATNESLLLAFASL